MELYSKNFFHILDHAALPYCELFDFMLNVVVEMYLKKHVHLYHRNVIFNGNQNSHLLCSQEMDCFPYSSK